MDSSLSAKIYDSRNCQRIDCASCSTNAPILAQAYLALSAKADKLLAAVQFYASGKHIDPCLDTLGDNTYETIGDPPYDQRVETGAVAKRAIDEYEGKERVSP